MGIRVNAALNQFNNGLVSPELEARTEMQVAAYSCRQLENASVEVAGGVHRRGGSVYVKNYGGVTQKKGWGQWERMSLPASGVIPCAYINGQYIASGPIRTIGTSQQVYDTMYVSSDLKHWEARSIDTKLYYYSYLQFTQVGPALFYNNYYTTDGTHWTMSADVSHDPAYYKSVSYNNGVYLYVTKKLLKISTDLNTWSEVPLPTLSARPAYSDDGPTIYASFVANNTFFLFLSQTEKTNETERGYRDYDYVLTSSDGANWQVHVTQMSFANFKRDGSTMTYVGGKYLLFAKGGSSLSALFESADGYAWTAVSFKSINNYLPLNMTAGQDTVYVLLENKDTTQNKRELYKSTDGVNWEADAFQPASVAYQICPYTFVGDTFFIRVYSDEVYKQQYYSASSTIDGTKAVLVPFVVNRNTAYVLEFGNKYVRFYKDHGQILSSEEQGLVVATPYSLEDLFDKEERPRLASVQKNDVLYLFHPDYPAHKLKRTGRYSFAIEQVHFKNGPWENISENGIKLRVDKQTGTANVYASSDFFTEDMVGRFVRIYHTNINTFVWQAGMSVVANTEYKSDGKFYTSTIQGTAGNVKPTHTEGSATDGSMQWTYVHSGYGSGKITKVVSATQAVVTVVETFPASVYNAQGSSANASETWQLSMAQNPVCGCFYKDRLLLGINGAEGPVVAFSKTGDYENFDDQEFGEQLANCAMKLPVLTELSEIQWLSARESLYVGTAGAVTEIAPQTTSSAFGPENITYNTITRIGSNCLPPILLGGSELYVGAEGKSIYDLLYVNDNQAYDPQEVSLLSATWLKKGLKAWALQYNPDRIVWCVVKDGSLLGLTYNNSQQVRAFHKHTTKGQFISVAVIPSPDGQTDELWAIVKRKLNGADTYCVEYFRDGLPLDIPASYTEDEQQAFRLKYAYYVDCGKQITNDTASASVNGLTWLAGEKVDVLADGIIYRGLTVGTDGTLLLPKAATVVTVGLPYETTFEPLPVHVDGANGTGNARAQRINKMVVRLLTSGGFWYGERENKMDFASLRRPEERADAIALKSGDLFLNWNGSQSHNDVLGRDIPNATGARMIFKQKDPLPLRILAIYPQLEITND